MYKKILFASDFDEVGQRAAAKAQQMSELCGAELHLVHVVELMPAYAYPGFPGFTEVEATLQQHASEQLQEVAAKLNVEPQRLHVVEGATKNEILRVAEEIKADLILCGSHAKHGIELLLGSTANAVIHGAKCDVLVIRGDEG